MPRQSISLALPSVFFFLTLAETKPCISSNNRGSTVYNVRVCTSMYCSHLDEISYLERTLADTSTSSS